MIHHIPPPLPLGPTMTTTTTCEHMLLDTYIEFVPPRIFARFRSYYRRYRKWSFDRNHRQIVLKCFYYNTHSQLPGLTALGIPSVPPNFPSKIRNNPAILRPTFNHKNKLVKWYCRFCDCDNVLDENGDIASDLIEMRYQRRLPYSKPEQHHRTFVADGIFCGECSRRQEFHANQMSSWLPADDHPDYAFKLARAKEHKADLLSRYPIVCALCQGGVEHELRKQEWRHRDMINNYKRTQATAQKQPPRRPARKERIKKMLLLRARQLLPAISFLLPFPIVVIGVFSQLSLLRLLFHGVVHGFQLFLISVGHTLSTTSDTRWFMIHHIRFHHIVEAIFPSALVSCTFSGPFPENCYDGFITHRATLLVETAIFVFFWTEFGAWLNYKRKTMMARKPRRVTLKGPILALGVIVSDQIINTTLVSTLSDFWASLFAGVAFFLVAKNLWASIKIGYQWLSPRERSQRKRPADVTSTLVDLGYQNTTEFKPVQPPLDQFMDDPRDSGIATRFQRRIRNPRYDVRHPQDLLRERGGHPVRDDEEELEWPRPQRMVMSEEEGMVPGMSTLNLTSHRRTPSPPNTVPHGRPSPFDGCWPVRHQPPPPPQRGP
ncbi:Ima1 N-terminal domain-containing protein [Phlyctochytrium arcticum]|nr:Ima1 N-terminal domain-containing protein [Phlyctochytrium arcticum]